MAVFGAILGFATLTPATHYLQGYCYATQNKKKESAEIVKLIMKLYQ
jgi:hypothetical protein